MMVLFDFSPTRCPEKFKKYKMRTPDIRDMLCNRIIAPNRKEYNAKLLMIRSHL